MLADLNFVGLGNKIILADLPPLALTMSKNTLFSSRRLRR